MLDYVEKGMKRMFLVGLLLISMEMGSFGESLMKEECVWACTSCSIIPPAELLGTRQTKGEGGTTVTNAKVSRVEDQDQDQDLFI